MNVVKDDGFLIKEFNKMGKLGKDLDKTTLQHKLHGTGRNKINYLELKYRAAHAELTRL